ncbi:hypothetical protein SAMN05443248_2878 [Bradyrhizobium erythrophlei]|jgi:hypothetical protein|uniref:Uncharacterized protein n=1 Tax=Bradyrhizobium erythrophlei TaxID=1437360 RepID=A0A1M5N8P4_9BRAD|nr:hypothetical protein SAMN05443248_2878 [Bradyrhizobium erythrophlei]
MVRSAPEFIIGPRFARTRWRVSNHESPDAAILRDGACAPPQDEEETYRPVFTRVQSRLMIRCVAGSRAVITNSFFSVASSG